VYDYLRQITVIIHEIRVVVMVVAFRSMVSRYVEAMEASVNLKCVLCRVIFGHRVHMFGLLQT
jgi:hypothetical protein